MERLGLGGYEFRLLFSVVVNGVIFAGAWRFVSRWGSADRVQRMLDVFLVWYLVQYLTTSIVGILGILSSVPLALGGLLMSAILWFLGRGARTNDVTPSQYTVERVVLTGAALFVLGFEVAAIYLQALPPVMSTDGLAYHCRWQSDGCKADRWNRLRAGIGIPRTYFHRHRQKCTWYGC